MEKKPDLMDELIHEYLHRFGENNLFRASLDSFRETGRASGSFRASLRAMLEMYHKSVGQSQNERLLSALKEPGPIHLKDMALTNPQFLTILNYSRNNGNVIADTLLRDKDTIEADFFHTKETNEKIAVRNAVDLTISLLRKGIRVEFLDGAKSTDVLKSVSPPLYDKYYRTPLLINDSGER